jgi:CHAT domain-containing protein
MADVAFVGSQAQDSLKIKSSDKAEQLYKANKLDEVLKFCEKELSFFLKQKIKDSTEIAWLSYYQFETQCHFKDYLEGLKSANLGITYCPNTPETEELKAILHYKRAYAENNLNFPLRSRKSMLKAADLFSKLENPNDDYRIGAYTFLSSDAAYHGNMDDAERYLRLADKVYRSNKEQIDLARTDSDGNYDRYEVILPYRMTYMWYKNGKGGADSLKLVTLLKKLNALHDQPEFNKKYEGLYYNTALNHIGDWYATYKPDSLLSEVDLKLAQKYIDQSLDLLINEGYPGNYFQFQFNKCKVLSHANALTEAEQLINHLLDSIPPNYGGKPFFLAQHGLIKAKAKDKKSALNSFYKAIEHIHSGDSALAKDFSNFKPNQSFGQTRLILRIAEKLNLYFQEDPKVQKVVAQLYYMAFIQFENSYEKTKFNTKDNKYLRQIIQGILTMQRKGYGINQIPNEDLLNRTETLMSRLAWQRFNQNRYTNNLADLDSLSARKLTLRSLIAKAKLNTNKHQQDSLEQLIEMHQRYTQKAFPNLKLFKDKTFDLKQLQNRLNPDELVLKYLVLEQNIAIFKITKNSFDVQLKPWTQTEINLVSEVSEALKNRSYNPDLANGLVEVLLPELSSNIKHLRINPDGVLCRLPFEILKVKDQYLTEILRLSYTSSLGFLYPELHQTTKTEELAIYVPDYAQTRLVSNTRSANDFLIGAKQEAQAIASLFPSTIYSGKALTKHEFIETAKQSNLIHLAMHAQVNNDTPGLSRLLFSQNENENEDLFLEELYGLSLGAELAVLSACNTGVGKTNEANSMASFQRAFTFAGVPATVASLWEVPDGSTKQIMQSFYSYLSQGQSKSEALQNAKLDYINANANTKLAEPYYWAGFVVYGSDAAVSSGNSQNILLIVLSIVLLLVLGYFLWVRYQKKSKI